MAKKEEAEAYARHQREVRERWRLDAILAEREARGLYMYISTYLPSCVHTYIHTYIFTNMNKNG